MNDIWHKYGKKFSADALLSVMLGQEFCRSLSREELTTGMLLYGLSVNFKKKSNKTAEVLTDKGITPKVIQTFFSNNFEKEVPITGELTTSARCVSSVEKANLLSIELHYKKIYSEHLLLSLIENEKGSAKMIFEKSKVDLQDLKSKIRNQMQNQDT